MCEKWGEKKKFHWLIFFIAWLVYTINMPYSNMKNYENIYNCSRVIQQHKKEVEIWQLLAADLLNFHSLHIYLSYKTICHGKFKRNLYFFMPYYLWPKTVLSLKLVVNGTILWIVEQPYPLTGNPSKIRNYKCVKSIFVDSNFVLYFCTMYSMAISFIR